MRIKKLILPLGLFFSSAVAHASHKSWYLVDPGANCHATLSGDAQFVVYSDGALTNNASYRVPVSCPITLAGRFASQNQFPMARWASSRTSTVYGFDASTSFDFTCKVWVTSTTGSTYYGNDVTLAKSTPSNVQISLSVYTGTAGYTWGGTVGNGGTLSVRSMGYSCYVPPGSSIYAYSENICQKDSSCQR